MIPTHCPLCNLELSTLDPNNPFPEIIVSWLSCKTMIKDSPLWHFSILPYKNEINSLIVSYKDIHVRVDYGINSNEKLDPFRTKIGKIQPSGYVEKIIHLPQPIYFDLTSAAIENKIKMLLTFC